MPGECQEVPGLEGHVKSRGVGSGQVKVRSFQVSGVMSSQVRSGQVLRRTCGREWREEGLEGGAPRHHHHHHQRRTRPWRPSAASFKRASRHTLPPAADPKGTGSTTARPRGTGSTTAKPKGTESTTARPKGTGSTSLKHH